jgi:hypothetical protein
MYKLERKVPPRWSELRWCIVRASDGLLICHRDKFTDAQEMVARMNALDSLTLANQRKDDLLNGISVEQSLSHSELLNLSRATRGESCRWDG